MFLRPVVSAAIGLGAIVATSACDTQRASAKPRVISARDTAEQVLYGARSALAANGVRRGDVAGDTVLVFDAATRFEFDGLRATFISPLGRPLGQLTAPSGTYRVPGGVVAHGATTIVSDTLPRRIQAHWVRYDPATNEIASDSQFIATAGTRRLSGIGFIADPGLFSVKCQKQCVGSLGP